MHLLATVPLPPCLPLPCVRFHPIKEVKTPWKARISQFRILEAEPKRILTDVHRPDTHPLLGHGRCLKAKFGKAGQWLE